MNRKETTDVEYQYIGRNSLIPQAILNVWPKLPADVREFIQEQCVFVSVGEEASHVLVEIGSEVRQRNKNAAVVHERFVDFDEDGKVSWMTEAVLRQTFWVITLYDGIPPEYLEGFVAFECAHAWIKQNGLSDDPEMLMAFWGFDDTRYRQRHGH
jgi:hypothetical protein